MDKSVIVKEKLKTIFSGENLSKVFSVASIVILVVIFTSINPRFIIPGNITNILNAMAPLLAMASGVALVLMLGSVDLSIGAVVSCSAVMLTVLFDEIGAAAYVVVIFFGIFAGLLNGAIHNFLKIPSFITTLCTMSIWQSVALIVADAQPLPILPPAWPLIDWGRITFGVIPILFVVALGVNIVYTIISIKTRTGRAVLFSGSNEKAARLMGMDITRAKMTAFTLSGLSASIAGILFSVMLRSGIPTVGDPYTLMAIASAVLGGVALSGGRGAIPMVIIGALLINIIQNGMNVIAVDGFWQQIVFGVIVILAIFMNSDRKTKNLIIK